MGVLNGIYIWVADESVDRPVVHTTHPVESGVNITDHVKSEPAKLSITGKVVGSNAEQVISTLKRYETTGAIVSWVGRSVFLSAQITALTATYTKETTKGCDITLGLQEARVAVSAWKTGKYKGKVKVKVRQENGTVQTVNASKRQKRYHTLRTGETLLFISRQYGSKGATLAGLKSLNKGRNVFQPGKQGNFNALRLGAKLLLGVW